RSFEPSRGRSWRTSRCRSGSTSWRSSPRQRRGRSRNLSYAGARRPSSVNRATGSGGRAQLRVVIDDDLVAHAGGGVKPPALRIRRTALRQHIARRVPGDEGRGSGQGHAHQPRRLGAELGKEEIEADLVKGVGLLDDLSGRDV